jgi:hypothetical protein
VVLAEDVDVRHVTRAVLNYYSHSNNYNCNYNYTAILTVS